MNLDEDQKKTVSGWIADGRSVSEIQDLLRSELQISRTYMEVRFLVDDLGLQLKDAEPEPEPEDAGDAGAPDADEASDRPGDEPPLDEEAGEAPVGNVAVTVDQIARPGAIVSGSATFSDGNRAEWMLDQMGRLGVVPEVEGYKPSAADVALFQAGLQEELQKLGF